MTDILIRDTCTHCGACVAVCPARVFVKAEDVRASNPGGCILCGHCVAVCPVDAVIHHGFDGLEFPPVSDAAHLETGGLAAFLRSRRSVREFRDKPISRDTLEKLLDIAHYAPTASNVQGVRYVVITEASLQRAISRRIVRWMVLAGKLARMPGVLALAGRGWGRQRLERYLCALDGLMEVIAQGRDPIFYGASALIVTHAHKANAFGIEDSAYATYQLALAAQAMGLGTCMIGFLTTVSRYDPVLRRMAGVPKGHRMTTAMVVGYPIYRYRRLIPRKPARVRWMSGEEKQTAAPASE